jgi:tripartite-type tricarboxylate transporter receptor subunit TctC
MIRRMPILLVLTALLYCAWAATAAAPAFPARPIRFVVGFAPGGGNDLLARIVGQKVSERLGQQVVIDNRPGAGGNLGAELAARSTPDGHTILMMSSSHPIQGLLKHRLPYDPIADFAPISRLATYSYLLVVHPNLPARSTKELVAAAKSASPAMIFVSSGNGSGSHLAGELFKSVAGVDLTHVPYKGTAQAITDLIAGRVQLMFSPMPAVIQHVRAGRLRVVAFTGSRRSAQLPDVPTVAESGIAQFVVSPWYGVIAPARVPPAVVATLNRHINDVLKLPEIEQQLRSEGAEPSGSTPQEFARLIRAEHDKWREVIARTGIKVD